MLGITVPNESSIEKSLNYLVELEIEAADWIDIGAPLKNGEAIPYTIKS